MDSRRYSVDPEWAALLAEAAARMPIGSADVALTGGAVVGTASGAVGGPGGLSAAPLRGRVVRVVQAIDGSTCVEVSLPGQRTVPGGDVEIVPDGHGSRADRLAQEVSALRLEADELRDLVCDALAGRPIAARAAALGVIRG